MALGTLEHILSRTEYLTISETIREKLEQFFKKQEENHTALKVQHAKLQTQSEQKCFELDVQLQQIQEQTAKDEQLVKSLSDEKSQLDKQIATTRQQQKELEAKVVACEQNLQELKRERDALQLDKDDLTSLLSRRNDDLDRLTMDLRTLTDQLVLSNKEKCEALIKTEELNSKQLALEYKEKRIDQEKDLLARQQQFLQEELEKRTKEILTIRREKNNKVLELQAELSEKIDEIKMLQKNVSDLTSANEGHQSHIKELTEEMRVRAENELKISENNRHELRSQTRLCELYKMSSEDAQAKADELTKATEELQRLLREASSRYGELETSSKAEVDQLKEKLEQDRKAIEELQKELERANTLLDASKSRLITEECMETMSPSAAAASRLLKSGMTLTQIYSQYVSVSEQMLFKEEENKRLNSYIDQILQEIESRAPAMARQREDYEKSVEMVASLTSQLELAAEEAESERQNAIEARRQLLQMERSHQRYQKQVQDLGAQVRFLLREIEILKGNRIPDRSDSEMEVSSSDGSAAQVISRHLVTFRDIEEIQKKNQELLHVVRELSEKQDEVEKNAVDTRTAKIQQALENALSEIENLRETRRRHEELVESVVQQRDMYRKIVQEAGLNTNQSPTKFRSDFVTSTPAAPSKSEGLRSSFELEKLLSETSTLLQQSEQKYAAAVKEKQESEKELRDKIECLNDQLTETRSQNARVAAQIQYMEEKEKLLQGNLDSYKKQLSSLEEKNKNFACTIAKHEQSIAILKDEALSSQQNLSRYEVMVSMLREEKQLLKDAEQRLLIERDSLLGERRSQGLLHANLESIKLNLERTESENRMRLQNSVTSFEQQCELLRKKLDVEEERYRQTVKSFEDRIQMDQVALKAAQDRAEQAEATVKKLQEMVSAAEMHSRIASPIRKGEVTRLLSSTASTENNQTSELRSQVTEFKAEADTLREQLELVRQQAEQYRAIADSMEEELKKSNEASQSFRKEMEQHVTNVTSERDALTLNLQQAQEKLKAMEEDSTLLRQERAQQSEEVARQISHLETNLKAISDKLKLAEESEAKAREECLEHVKTSQEAQEKYERELVQHAAAVEQLKAARDSAEECRANAATLTQTVARLEEELNCGKSSWESQKSSLEKQSADLTTRCTELDKQVDLMQQQIVTMSNRMTAMTRVQEISIKPQGEEDANKSLNVSFGEEETRSSEQLLELIRFLRREKEIAISRFEVTEAETHRLRTNLEQLQRQLTEAQASLQHERERSATSTLTSSKHTELLRKLETLNALTDSNRLLREERTTLATEKEELVSKISALEVELQPLRDASRDLNTRIDELTAENQTLRRQVVAWKARTNSLQERAGRATADDLKRVQLEKEQLQKQLEQSNAKTSSVMSEFQRTNSQLLVAQQKQLDEIKKLKEEAQQLIQKSSSLQEDVNGAEAKRKEEESKANEKAEALRRIARKYKAQFEELKTAHDKLVSELPSSTPSAAASTASSTSTSTTSDTATEGAAAEASAVDAANAAKLKELEEQNSKLLTEMEQLKNNFESIQSTDEKTKLLLKNCRVKINSLNKDKEVLTNSLQEANAKIESLEQSLEEANVRATALRSQLEGRISRLERENSDLIQAKQAVDNEVEILNQRIPVIQRQVEAYQKQLSICQQQQQQQQATQQVKPAVGAEKSPAECIPPTANIKPMASGNAAIQRPSSSPSQPSTSLAHRTTPTASIRPMAMPSRTAAVQPTATVSVSPMAPPIAVATPTPVFQTAVPSATALPSHPIAPVSSAAPLGARDEGGASIDPIPSTSGASSGSDAMRKRARPAEADLTTEEQEQKRTRVESEEMEEGEHIEDEEEEEAVEDVDEVEVIGTVDNSAQGAVEAEEEDANRAEEVELVADEENEEGLIESEDEAKEGEEDEEEEEIIEVDEQRDEGGDSNLQMEVADSAVDEEAVAVPVVSVQQDEGQPEHLAEESIEPEAFGASVAAMEPSVAPATESSGDLSLPGPSGLRPPVREDRLPSIGRNTVPYEDGGDDGIVPSTPVLLRPRPNDGFAEAVSSPQVTTRFVFGSVPEELASATAVGVPQGSSHLSESQGMDDTRMDLTQLEENSACPPSIPLQVSPVEVPSQNTVPTATPVLPLVTVTVTSAEEQGDLEAAQDLEADAAAELDLLGEDDAELRENPTEQTTSSALDRSELDGDKTVTGEETPGLDEPSAAAAATDEAAESAEPSEPTPTTSSQSVSVRPPLSRRGAGFAPRGRGIGREPIIWSPGPNPTSLNPAMPSRGALRRAPIGTPVVPMAGSPAIIQEPGAINSARGRRGRARPRGGRRI